MTCILCNSIVRSEDVWKVHINAKQHKQNILIARELKEKTKNFSTPPVARKRPAETTVTNFNCNDEELPMKKRKSILKNAHTPAKSITEGDAAFPDDFFDSNQPAGSSNFFEATLRKTSIKKGLVKIKRGGDANAESGMEVDTADADEVLPEGFFDDPVKDAKARNSEYKDPIEEEWERFQKEIKDAANISNAIIAEEQDEATADRQIDEIDEQMRNWSRVLELEKKKKEVVEKEKSKPIHLEKMDVTADSDDGSDQENDDFSEYLDWRAKRL